MTCNQSGPTVDLTSLLTTLNTIILWSIDYIELTFLESKECLHSYCYTDVWPLIVAGVQTPFEAERGFHL